MLHLEHTSESRSEIPGHFEMWSLRMMEKISWNDSVRNEEVLHTVKKKDYSAVGRSTELQVGRSRVRFPMVSLEFFPDVILPTAVWAYGRLSL